MPQTALTKTYLAWRRPERMDLYDLTTMWTIQAPIASWTVVARTAVLVDDTSFVIGGQQKLLRARVDTDRLEEIRVDAGGRGDPVPIPFARR